MSNCNINSLTLGEIKEVARIVGVGNGHALPYKIGSCYLIRTVTNYWVGRVTDIVGKFLTIQEASWVADTGKFSKCLKDGAFNEVEVVPSGSPVNVNTEAIVDSIEWTNSLPEKTK